MSTLFLDMTNCPFVLDDDNASVVTKGPYDIIAYNGLSQKVCNPTELEIAAYVSRYKNIWCVDAPY